MFKSLMKAIVGTALLPVDAARDIADMQFGDGRDPDHIAKRLRGIGRNLDTATKPKGD